MCQNKFYYSGEWKSNKMHGYGELFVDNLNSLFYCKYNNNNKEDIVIRFCLNNQNIKISYYKNNRKLRCHNNLDHKIYNKILDDLIR